MVVDFVTPDDPRVQHSNRFRHVSNRYPYMVAMAYDRDLAAAAADSDEEVAARVAAYERAQGLKPRDWYAIGAEEPGTDENTLDSMKARPMHSTGAVCAMSSSEGEELVFPLGFTRGTGTRSPHGDPPAQAHSS